MLDSFVDIEWGLRCGLEAIGAPVTGDLLGLSRSGIGLEEFFARAVGATDDRERLERFVAVYRESYFDNPQPGDLYPGVLEGLAEIRARWPQVPTVIATTKRTAMAQRLADRTGLTEVIDHVQGSDGMATKPDPAVLHAAAAGAGRSVQGAAMVGDTRGDMLAAHAAGCAAIGVSWGGLGGPGLLACATAEAPVTVIDEFRQLVSLVGEYP